MTRVFARLGGGFVLAAFSLAAGANGASAHVASSKPVAPLAGEFHRIQNVGNGKCLQPQASPGTRIVQLTCNGSSEQGWLALNDGSNRYRFVNGSGRGCISVNDTPVNGGPVQLDNCTLSDGSGRAVSNAQWNSGTVLPDVVTLKTRVRNVNNNFCLDVPGASSVDGLAMQLFTCNGSLAQRWVVGFN
jgi:hypothetical protein